MSPEVGMLQGQGTRKNHQGQPPAHAVQATGKGQAHLGERARTQIQTSHRAGGRLRADEIRHAVQTVPTLRQGQGQHGLCLLRHRLQHQENDCHDEKGGIGSHLQAQL